MKIFNHIKKVSSVPVRLAKTIGVLTGNKRLKEAASLFGYFEKVNESGDPDEANSLLGKPEISFKKWIYSETKPETVYNIDL